MASSSLLALPPYATTSPPRLQALYSDISRQKSSNPTSYHANIEWWRKALSTLVREGFQSDTNSKLVLKATRALPEILRAPGAGKPLSLGSVITELRDMKALIPRSQFLNAKESIYDPGWLPARIVSFVVGKPLWWALEQLGVTGEEGLLGPSDKTKHTGWWGDYVVTSIVEDVAEAVLQAQEERCTNAGDRLYTIPSFRREFSFVFGEGSDMSEDDAKVLLRFLDRDKGAVVLDQDLIKFVDANDVHQITTVDQGLLALKTSVSNLQAQVDDIQRRIQDCTLKASRALNQKQKTLALGYLRSRKHLDELLQKRSQSLSNLESTLLSVETAAGDIEIIKSYESSAATLRAVLAHPALQQESIENTLEALAQANADAHDVDEAIRVGGDIAVGVEADASDLEKELEELAAEAQAEAGGDRLAERMKNLSPPSTEPIQPVSVGDKKLAIET